MAVIDLSAVDEGDDVVAAPRTDLDDRFEELYRRYAGDLRRFCRRRLGDDAADDACHEAMMRAHRALPAFRHGERMWPWLATIAANVCTDMLRQRRFAAYDDRDVERPHPGDLHDEVMTRLRRQLVDDALDGLPSRYRRPITLCDLEGWSYEEIAEVDGTTVGAVRGNLHRGRRALRERVQQVAREKGLWPLPAVVPLRWRDKVASLRVSRQAEALAPMAPGAFSLAQMAAATVAVLSTMVPGAAAAAGGGYQPDEPGATSPIATARAVEGGSERSGAVRTTPPPSAPAPAADFPVAVPEVAAASSDVDLDGDHRTARGEILWDLDGDGEHDDRTWATVDADCTADVWNEYCRTVGTLTEQAPIPS